MINNLNLDTHTDFPEFEELTNEIQFAKYILVDRDVEVSPNRSPGDYPVGGYLVASTETYRGAPTKIYPKLIGKLSSTQLVQMIIHEALHRTLPSPMNESEEIVNRVTNFLTQFTSSKVVPNLKKYMEKIRTQKIAWIAYVERNQGDGGYYLQNELINQEIINPLVNDSTIIQSTNEDSSRIKIYLNCNFYNSRLSVTVFDNYRKVKYNFVYMISIKDLSIRAHANTISRATQFIRDSINKIQDSI
ncbi:MAG: hypothetical protein U0T83_09310 [Bacteriovoracaceae bacterium]